MGYLNNTTVTVDAILTKKGRELLAKGGNAFQITQFALADDEIDYDLWNQSHPLGDDKMGVVIENLPITEAVPDETQSMKYKLITLSEGTKSIPYIFTDKTSIGLTLDTKASGIRVGVQTLQWNETGNGAIPVDSAQSYTLTMLDTTYFTIKDVSSGVGNPSTSGKSVTWTSNSDRLVSLTIGVNGDWTDASITGKSTKLIITNTIYGSRYVLPISYT